MTPKQKEQFNQMRTALRTIAFKYQTPAQRIKVAEFEGLSKVEALEYAYENIQQTARDACRGVKGVS